MRVLSACWCQTEPAESPALARRHPQEAAAGKRLLRVQLDDELLSHRRSHLAALRLAQHLGRKRLVVGLEPRGNLSGELGGVPHHLHRRSIGFDRDHIARPHLVAGYVHPAAVDRPMAVTDELTRLAAGSREAETHEDVVEPALEQREEGLARDAGLTGCLGVVAT